MTRPSAHLFELADFVEHRCEACDTPTEPLDVCPGCGKCVCSRCWTEGERECDEC